MGFWSALFGSKRPDGLAMDHSAAWEVAAPSDHPAFFEQLAALMPQGSILYLEGTSFCQEVLAFLSETSVEPAVRIAAGTLWPKPRVFHVPATAENLKAVSDFLERHAQPEVCDHLHVYADGKVLLEWYDALMKDPLFVSKAIPEQDLRSFCEAQGLSYKDSDRG